MSMLDGDMARMLADSVAAYTRGPASIDPVVEMHDQGWLQCALPEDIGGLGFGPDAAAIIAGGLARSCRAEPVSATYLAARLLALVAPGSAAARELGEEGRTVGLIHHGGVKVQAARLTGTAGHVPPAQTYLVVAEGALFALPAATIKTLASRRVDGVTLEVATFANTEAERIAEGAVLEAALRQALAETRLVIAAELMAHVDVMLDLTLEHLRTRQQFGQSLGHFQALQHKAVDLYGQTLVSRAVLDAAIARAAEGMAPDDLDRTAYRARARLNDTAMATAKGAIQMFGALGITEESPLAPHIKRVLAMVPWLGTSVELRRQYARLGRVLTRSTAAKDTAA
jgi:alkylation response protein AidB-like acyl-CoA dehydrogenase